MTELPTAHPPAPAIDQILSKQEAAALARISVRSWERHESEGTAPPRVMLGRRRVGFWRADVLGWLRSRTVPAKRAA